MMVMSDAEMSALPTEVQLIPFGTHETNKGKFTLDAEAAELVMKAAQTRQNDSVIDYEHQTLKDVEAPAAGWIKQLVNKGKDGIWGLVEWTPRATQYLKNKEYRYLSPVFLKSETTGRVVKFINAALTNDPAIDGMIPVVNKSRPVTAGDLRKSISPLLAKAEMPVVNKTQLDNGGATAENTTEENSNMDQILQALGLDPTATIQDALSAIEALKNASQQQVACKGVLEVLGLKANASESEVTGTIMAMKTGSTATADLVKQVNTLNAKIVGRDADDLVTQAMKDGKVLPAQKDWALAYAKSDPEGFKTFVAKAVAVVPVGEIKPGDLPAKPEGELTETEMQVCKRMGISREDFLKHNKKEAA